ncbi:DUF6134 family protein [Thalassobaculum sp.]|uniref:DUF6134 family protein n=1 Tax=Thalassobaculum sp. TaxID=2022740 RepID=UPI0032EDE714
MQQIDRRRFFEGITSAGLFALSGLPVAIDPHRATAARAGLARAYPEILKFAVTREGSPLGVVMERFGSDGTDDITQVYIDFKVDIAFITVYRYEHRSRERWRDGRLFALDTVTNDDGEAQQVTARASSNGLLVDGTQGRIVAPADILPSSYWHPRFVEQSRMLDSQLGRILDFTITKAGSETIEALGRPTPCTRYAMRGDIDLDFWYDADRVWQKMTFTIGGGFIEYTRVAPDPADAALFATPLRDGRAPLKIG